MIQILLKFLINRALEFKFRFIILGNSTHTCDLSKFNADIFESNQLNCLPNGNAPERVIISLQSGYMEWSFYRNGQESFSDSKSVSYVRSPNSDNSGLCAVRNHYSDFSCNVPDCRTFLYFGTNKKTGKVEMVVPADKLQYCRGANKATTEQIITFD